MLQSFWENGYALAASHNECAFVHPKRAESSIEGAGRRLKHVRLRHGMKLTRSGVPVRGGSGKESKPDDFSSSNSVSEHANHSNGSKRPSTNRVKCISVLVHNINNEQTPPILLRTQAEERAEADVHAVELCI